MFSIVLTCVMFFLSSACDYNYTSGKGFIISQNFPNSYPANMECHYLIKQLDPAVKITLLFRQFSVETHEKCIYDSVKIYDGDSISAKQLGPSDGFCGDCKPPSLISTRNSLLIVFVSDATVSSSGFNITYKGKTA